MRRFVVGLWYPTLAYVAIYFKNNIGHTWSDLGGQIWYMYITILLAIGAISIVHLVIEQINPNRLLRDLEADTASLWTRHTGIMFYTSFGGLGNGHNLATTKF